MRILSLTQPWASAIPLGLKAWETRSWSTKYRGLVGIHAALGFPKGAKDFAGAEWLAGHLPVPSTLPRGAVVAVAYISDCIPTEDAEIIISDLERQYGDYSQGRWAWKLTAIQPIESPISCKGSLGLWTPPEWLQLAIKEQFPIPQLG